ncbi:DUF4864 domain-containing protein [Salinispira pacifica]|uniref:DUF4864 domain-containing protein n=1 Tax=Salinispira pacifica TaxID=1307761 RepID=V5WI67_9SPIO|nr:DUF4864 domain-containing protein [Salinispira pacifica]AHC14866.1 hypothetical protein L21SP2_1469 [Salinispira pacifica]
MKKQTIYALAAGISLFTLLSCMTGPLRNLHQYYPDPDLDPAKVVDIQLQALQHNNDSNDGIEIVYRFAAPANKASTGPLPRFIRLFESRQFAPMLGSEEIELLDFRIQDDIALQGTRVQGRDGRDRFYLFILQKQGGGEFENCWMTIAVQQFSGELPGPEFSTESQSV